MSARKVAPNYFLGPILLDAAGREFIATLKSLHNRGGPRLRIRYNGKRASAVGPGYVRRADADAARIYVDPSPAEERRRKEQWRRDSVHASMRREQAELMERRLRVALEDLGVQQQHSMDLAEELTEETNQRDKLAKDWGVAAAAWEKERDELAEEWRAAGSRAVGAGIGAERERVKARTWEARCSAQSELRVLAMREAADWRHYHGRAVAAGIVGATVAAALGFYVCWALVLA